MYQNLIAKYGITVEQLKDAINQIKLEKLHCNIMVLIALTDLLCNGDIPAQEVE